MKLYLIAGEPSGDNLGAALMAGLKSLRPEVEFAGVGGPAMQAEGLSSLFPMQDLSVMGLAEVLPKLPKLLRRKSQTVRDVLAHQPDALITIDSPDFSLRVARAVRAEAELPTIHYGAPTVWAWRPERAAKMAEMIDHVLALFPFEPPYMTAAGMSCDFVGHPVATSQAPDAADVAQFRAELGEGDPVVLVLPGSRHGEVSRLAPIFGETLAHVVKAHPKVQVVVPTVQPVAGLVREVTQNWPVRPVILQGDVAQKAAAFAVADVALAASGTVSLELAASRTPMVIGYTQNWLTLQIMKRKLLVDTVTLVNLVSETRAVPEFLGNACQPKPMADALLEVIRDGPARVAQLAAADLTMARLGQGGENPGLRAARSVLKFLDRR